MWDANVGATERVLDAAISAGIPRIVYISTVGVFGDTHGELVDETYRRDLAEGFLSWYDETKFRAHEAAEERDREGRPDRHRSAVPGVRPRRSLAAQRAAASRRTPASCATWPSRTPVSAGSTSTIWPRASSPRSIEAGSVRRTCSPASACACAKRVAIAARVGGRKPPRADPPDRAAQADGADQRPARRPARAARQPAPRRSAAGDGVTYWAKHDKATARARLQPRSLEQGIADTWGSAGSPRPRNPICD